MPDTVLDQDNKETVTPAEGADKNPNPGQDEGGDAADANKKPEDTPEDGTPASDPEKGKDEGKPDFSQLLAKYGENVVTGMVEEKEKAEAIIADPKQMEKMTKEQVVQLYALRDNLSNQLNEILPALTEKRQSEFAKSLDGIENEEVKSVVMEAIKDVQNEDEVQAIVGFAKQIVEKVSGAKAPADGGDAPDDTDPGAIKSALKGGKDNIQEEINISEGLLSHDPEVRAKAKKAADAAFKQIAQVGGEE